MGVGRTEQNPEPCLDDYYAFMAERNLMLPVFEVDVRRADDVLMMLDVMFNMLELAEEYEEA